jgi:transcriptional regulator with XRE-family HTH domain
MHTKLGYTLKLHRIAAGLTREQVAVRTGLSVFTIAAMEQGRAASINALAHVLRCYGMALGDLLPVDEEGREQAIHDCRIKDVVSDYSFAVGEAGNLSGTEL